MLDRRRTDLARHLDDLRKIDGWQPFQHFVLGLLHHEGYTDVRYSAPRSDFGRDAVAITPQGERCVVAVSFECTKAKVLSDAKRWAEDPDREPATVLLFITSEAPAETTWSKWKKDVAKLGLELRIFHRGTILQVATQDRVWPETAARLGLSADRPGFRVVTPYDGEQIRAALQARPAEWLAKRIELREWKELSGELRNRLILGKPGAGKTTTLFMHLETTRPERVLVVEPDLREGKVQELLDSAAGGGVIVFDDAHEKPNELRALLSALRARHRDVPEVSSRFSGVRLLIAARSQEWAEIQPPFSPTELQDLHLTSSSRVVLGALSHDQCRELVAACVEQWNVAAEPRLVELAAARAAERDATPLYVLSMLGPAREQGTLRDAHLATLPPTVLGLWCDYWARLTPVAQGVLRLVKLFAVTRVLARLELFEAAARAFSLTPHDVSASLDTLETALWISRRGDVPTCLDVQLEAIPLTAGDFGRWDEFVRDTATGDIFTRAELHNGTGTYYAKVRASKARDFRDRQGALLSGQRHFSAVAALVGEYSLAWRSLALNNLSNVFSELAGLETTHGGQFEWLRKAVEAGEESVRIFRELGAQSDLAMSLNNVAGPYPALAGLEATREGQGEWVRKAVEAVEEAVRIYRGLGVQGDLAMSLNNFAISYSALARLATTREGRREWLRKAVEAVEEAVRIQRKLGVQGDLAASLGTSCHIRRMRAETADDPDTALEDLRASRSVIGEAVGLFRESGNTRGFLQSLRDVVTSDLQLARAGDEVDWAALRAACETGRELARSMQENVQVAFFERVIRALDEEND